LPVRAIPFMQLTPLSGADSGTIPLTLLFHILMPCWLLLSEGRGDVGNYFNVEWNSA
jgi:hypothetical protein